MDPLALAAATAIVTAIATDGWQEVRQVMVRLWMRTRAEHVPAIESDLTDTRAEVLAARDAKNKPAEDALVADWELKLRRMLNANPQLESELRRVLYEELTPLLPAPAQTYVQNITASASGATAQGVMFGNVINYGALTDDSGTTRRAQGEDQP